jgi:hypothetical protein
MDDKIHVRTHCIAGCRQWRLHHDTLRLLPTILRKLGYHRERRSLLELQGSLIGIECPRR